MYSFPLVEPEVGVRDLPGEQMTVVCRDAQGLFILLQEGATCDWSFYDYPERRLTGVSRMKVETRLRIHGRECYEIADYYWEPGKAEKDIAPNHWYLARDDEHLYWVRFVWREKGKVGKSEEIEMDPVPTCLFVGLKAEGRDVYVCGDERRNEGIVSRSEITGVVEVTIAGRTYRCLREVWSSVDAKGTPWTLAELFFSEQGRTVFFRRYNGRGYANYESLKGNLELKYAGEVYRLWYDCIPDHALGFASSPPSGGEPTPHLTRFGRV